MKLIVGLGNPGDKYKNNRHNAGHMFVDYLGKELTGSRVNELPRQKKIIAVKTTVFMNQSGPAIRKLIGNLPAGRQVGKLKLENLIVVHDDLDIPLGKFKIQFGEGPKLHNGLASIEETFGTKKFLRIRIGIDARTSDNWIHGEQYVLSDFTSDEKSQLIETFPQILLRFTSNFLK